MSRAFAQLQTAEFSTDGVIFLTYSVMFIDVPTQRVEAHVVRVQTDAVDNANVMRDKVSAAIKAKGSELGLSISNNEITMPAFTKG